MDGVRMVKVDNWAAFFLQKLQALYTRGDFTDLTLQFHTNECIKVHRLVLNTCTEYFETLIQQNNATNHMRLPPNFQSDVVVPIINFMYSGRLEFRPELHHRLYNTAKILNMHILTKLLDTHAGPVGKTNTIQKLKHLTPVPASVSSPSIPSSPLTSRTYIKTTECESSDIVPGKRLPIWKKRTVPSSSFSVNVKPRPVVEEPAKPTRFEWPEDGDSDSAPILYSSTFDDISYDSVPIVKSINSIVQSALPPTPSQPLVQLPQQRVMPAATFESVYQSANLKRSSSISSQEGQPDECTAKKLKVDIDDVKELVQEQEVRKTLLITDDAEQENEDLDDFLPAADHDAEDFEDDNDEPNTESMDPLNPQSILSTPPSCHITPPSSRNTPKPILKVHDSPDASKESTPSKKVRFHLEPKVHAVTSTSVPPDAKTSEASESIEIETESTTADKNLPGNAGNNQPVGVSVDDPKMTDDSCSNAMEIRASGKKSSDGSSIQSKTPNATNHAKIIAEVLKKYPDLVKNNKNIRLKIIQKDGSPAVSVERPGGPGENKPKVSYMVVKADQAVKAKAQMEQYKTPSGVHNTTGPWICSTCDPENPINFETYYSFRKHLQEIHQEKVDVRICEHCGHRASKRNLLLYHLYKIHGIPPPPSCNFPKCDECNHIALSETLLAKHKNVHSHSSHAPSPQAPSSGPVPVRLFQCRTCNVTFSSQNALQNHLQNSLRCNPRKKSFKCPVCSKVFQLQLNLKNHIRSDHPNLKLLEDMGQTDVKDAEQAQISQTLQVEDIGQHQVLQHQQLQQHQQVQLDQPHQHPHTSQDQLSHQVLQNQQGIEVQSEVHTQPQTTYILPPGVTILTDNNQATLMPSTEAEALSNVASGIAASLGVADSMVVGDQGQHQTFIVVDKSSLIQIPGPPGAPGQVHEYIVPDIMNNDMGQSVGVYPGHLSQLVQYTTAGGGLQQPVAVSTSDQGLMTITTVNANGSIVNHTVPQQTGTPMMETAMMQIPQGHMQDHGGGEITMILTDHAYSEGIVRENGTVMQTTTVPVSMNMVPTSAVVSVVSAVPSIQTTVPTSSPMGDNGVQVMAAMPMTKVESSSDGTDSSSVNLDTEQQASGQPAQKMAELASDWDDVDEGEDNSGLSRSADEIAEDAALPSRPSIMLKSELDGDDIPDNLPMKIA